MAIQFTYVPIAAQTLSSTTASITFSSIPNTYQDLILIVAAQGVTASGTNNMALIFNGDSGTNYSMTRMSGNGSSTNADRASNTSYAGWTRIDNTGSVFSTNTFHIQNYANTNIYKTIIGQGSSATSWLDAVVSMWRSTAAINSISISGTGVSLAANSTATLYGIASA